MAAVLACGTDALLSDHSAGALFEMRSSQRSVIDVTVIRASDLRPSGIQLHRRTTLRPEDRSKFKGIPVTSPVRTLMDLATKIPPRGLEAAVNAADNLGLVDAETLREEVAARSGEPGSPALLKLLDAATFRLTESELERLFLPLAHEAGLPAPDTQVVLGAFRVDFHWRELGLVVEADSLRYHRSAQVQTRDLKRDQAHAIRGLRTVRFSHFQVRYEPAEVVATLRAVAEQLRETSRSYGPQQ